MEKEMALMQIIDGFTENVSLQKLIEKGFFEEMVELVKRLDEIKYLLPNYEFILILKEKIYCCYCLEHPIETITTCGHNLCTPCCKSIKFLQTDTSQEFLCLICQSSISAYVKIRSFRRCNSCQLYLPKNCFYSRKLISSYCKICIWKFYWDKNLNFLQESQKIDSKRCHCDKCGDRVLIKHANFLCRIHSYCFLCFKLGLSLQKCFCCKTKIGEDFFNIGRELMLYQCCYCRISKEKVLFVYKTCCKENVCASCQIEEGTIKCRNCQEDLDLSQRLLM